MYNIAIDFGTTNTLIGVYNTVNGKIEIFNIKELTKKLGEYVAIPSIIGYKNEKEYYIGMNVERHKIDTRKIFKNMKLYFSKYKARPKKIGMKRIYPQDAAHDFLSLILDLVFSHYLASGIEKVILTAPVDSFDKYRVFLSELCEFKGIYNYTILDEPTAVALGYGAIVSPDYPYLIADFGGGTLDINVIRLNNARKINEVNILGKSGLEFGGIDIDNWLYEDFLYKQNLTPSHIGENMRFRILQQLEELKINLINSRKEQSISINYSENDFELKYSLDFAEFNQILEKKKFRLKVQETLDKAVELAIENGVRKKEIKKVFLVGGSSLIPLFKEIFDYNFAGRVVLKEPFAAVIKGACNFISGVVIEDFLHHNYSIQHLNRDRGIYEYEVIVPQKTKYPINNVKQMVISTPYSGQTEIELKFFEVLENVYREEKISDIDYDEEGNLIAIKDEEALENSRKIIPLNTSKRCFITLDPPSKEAEDRIKLTFHVNKNRVLMVDAIDLKTGRKYYDKFEIARLK